MSCECRKPNETEFYSLKELATASVPKTIQGLQTWLGKTWDGKIYVAKSICWDGKQFRQSGCSPNYMADWWTLACCKHKMRASIPFKTKVSDYNKPTYVFTLSQCSDGKQPLVSVARITADFKTMEDYYDKFLKRRTRKLLSSRLSRELRDDGMLGWRFGDCHADSAGDIGRPHKDHVHAKGNDWKADCPEMKPNQNHLILVSNKFLVWGKPVFAKIQPLLKRSGSGINIDQSNWKQFLVPT